MKKQSPTTAASLPESRKTKRKGWQIALIIALAVLLVLGAVAGIIVAVNWQSIQQKKQDRKIVAVCNGYEIPYEELVFVTTLYKNSMAATYGENIWDDPATAEQYRAELEKSVKENLKQNYVVLTACKNLNIETSDSTIDNYVDQQIDALIEECGSKQAYREFLAEEGMTEHYLRFTLSIAFLESAIHYTMVDNDLYEYRYEDNSADFMDYVMESGEYVRTLHIYIENADGEDPAENLAKAQEISDKLKAAAAGEERRKLLSDYIGSALNDDLMTVTGDGYYFTHGEMDAAYETASFDLQIGEVSDPVVCSGGNFVIMRLEPELEYVAKNVKDLMDCYYGVSLDAYIETFRPGCDVYYTEYGKTLDLLALD